MYLLSRYFMLNFIHSFESLKTIKTNKILAWKNFHFRFFSLTAVCCAYGYAHNLGTHLCICIFIILILFHVCSIFINGLHYSDGSKNNTLDHQWSIHTGEITKDFFDWRNRCLSAGTQFNPYKVSQRFLILNSFMIFTYYLQYEYIQYTYTSHVRCSVMGYDETN